MVPVDERVFQLVVVVPQVHDGIGVTETFLHTQSGCQRSGNPVVDHHLQRDNLDLAAQLLFFPEQLDEMGFYAVLVQVIQQNGRYLVVQRTLSLETGPFYIVIGNRHVLVTENHLVGMVGGKDLLFVALED